MPKPRKYNIPDLAGSMFDLLQEAPVACVHDVRGYDIHELSSKLDIPEPAASKVIRCQRIIFGGDDEIGIPYHVCGRRRIYHLAGRIEEGDRWNQIRMRTELKNVEVSIAWWESMAVNHPGAADHMLVAYNGIKHRLEIMLGSH